MAFDTNTRNRLAKFVAEARRVLTEEFSEQLQSLYGISAAGGIAPLEKLTHLDAEGLELAATLRQRIAYLTSLSPAAGDATKPAIDRLTREQAFTVLNRLAAIRMAEKRGLIVESVGQSYQSKGFKVFESVAGSAIGDTYDRYRCYLFCLFDELAIDLGSLFDRRSPQALLFPRETSLLALLDLLDEPDLQDLWAEDETIGWIYQYYNDPAERKKMREESAAPRNSRELAVRNQFFTPRYVVEFLTDNTLGRIWYEMTQGVTALKEQCRYLVRRPDEVFLAHADSGEVEEAQAWLQDAKGKRPELWRLAHTVNGYARAGAPGEDSNRWVEDRLPRVKPDTVATLTTQELIDLLFLFCRKERFCEGTLDSLQAEIDLILATVETRSAHGRRSDASQEDLLEQPVFIAHRPLKDPRSILMLDPACGSMHFGLYAFDLFEAIYDEAWEIAAGSDAAAKSGEDFAPFCTFAASFADKAAFQREVPRMIVEHNVHGIDIDPRAAQIAGLSLWLRAQRAWHAAGVKPVDRPRITRSNIVCAEPMPGDKVLLAEFVEQQFQEGERAAFGFLLETVFDRMTLAGEAGSLLKIEEEIRTAIAEAKKIWEKEPAFNQRMLFGGENAAEVTQKKLDLSGITDEQFWEGAEERIYAALRDYAEQAESGGFQRRLFAEDAARGFAFIDVCRRRYDVALMNPPFGEASDRIRPLLEQFVSFTDNIAAPFGERFLLRSDFVAMVLDRALLIRKTHEAFRRLFLAKGANRLRGFANYGWGVLDANVEVAGVVASNCTVDATYLLAKEAGAKTVKWIPSNGFSALPNLVISDDVPEFVLSAFAALPALGDFSGCARVGHQWKSERFLRLWWEGNVQCGPFVYNGAPFSPYVFITRNRMACDPNAAEVAPETSTVLRNQSFHYLPGVAYGKRGIHLDAHFLPAAHTFTVEGLACFPDSISERLVLLAYLNSLPVSGLLQFFCGQHKHVGYLNCLPFSQKWKLSQRTGGNLLRFLNLKRSLLLVDETSPIFGAPFADGKRSTGIAADWNSLAQSLESLSVDFNKVHNEVGAEVAGWLGFPAGWENNPAFKETMTSIPAPDATDIFDEADFQNETAHCARMMGILVGHSFGRWDIRYATGEQAAPELPDPFAPLPVCPPGLLQNAQGLPAGPEDVPATYPVKNIPWDGILVDDPNHPLDIERRVREVIEIIWTGKEGSSTAEAIEVEACEILGVKTLRDYFRKPANFFADHLKRYSKSRRQAPIYWPLSTKAGSYTLWIYYHRLNDQTLHKCLADFLDPKIKDVESELGKLTGKDSGRAADLRDFLNELKDLKDEIERVIKLPWKPNLNDGVLITASPLWKLFRLSKWQKDLKACWEELEKGDYDWAHLAYTIWPERVEKVCEKDRSIAIAHGLEHLCKIDPPKPKKPRGKKASS